MRKAFKIGGITLGVVLVIAVVVFISLPDPAASKVHPIYDSAVKKSVGSDIVAEHLGAEIDSSVGWDKAEYDEQKAFFKFMLVGEYGSADVTTEGENRDGEWIMTSLKVETPDGSTHDLLR